MFSFLIFIIQPGAANEIYNNAAEGNSFIGTFGSMVLGGIIIWLLIMWDSNRKQD